MNPSALVRLFGVLVALANASSSAAQACRTVNSGSFLDAANWDCGCVPLQCDSILVQHAMILSADGVLDVGMMRVENGASLSTGQRLSIGGRLENEGAINAAWLHLHGSGVMRNSGSIDGQVVIMVHDTTFNTGTIVGEDSLIIGWYKTFFNSGALEAGFFYELGYLFNNGQVLADSSIARFFINIGSLSVNGSLFVGGGFLNEGALDAGEIEVVASFENHGAIRCYGTFTNGWGAAESILHEGSELLTVDFINPTGCLLSGPGTLCLTGSSENHGAISGPINICDITLPPDALPPYMDVNTGSYLLPIYRCAIGTCATVDIVEPMGSGVLSISPVPAHEQAVLRFPGVVGSILLHDAQGRLAARLQGPFQGEARIHRPGLPDGWYAARMLGLDGGLLGTVRMLFIGP